ncbi:MAG TPA: hypothetical protein VFZ41_00660 [Solirubrobacterales bacterium]
MADRLDDLVTAAVRAWAVAARAWIEAGNAIGVSWLDLPAVESGRTGFNEETVVVPAQPAATELHSDEFAGWDEHKLPPEAITVLPPRVDAGEETEVCVRIQAPPGTPSGTYTGSLCSPGGTCLVDRIGVYVVGDST